MKKEPTVDINSLQGETTFPMPLQTGTDPVVVRKNGLRHCSRTFSKSDSAVLEAPRGQPRGKHARGKSNFDHRLPTALRIPYELLNNSHKHPNNMVTIIPNSHFILSPSFNNVPVTSDSPNPGTAPRPLHRIRLPRPRIRADT